MKKKKKTTGTSLHFKYHLMEKMEGWLNVKPWPVLKKKKLELTGKKSWKRSWVTLNDTSLILSSSHSNTSSTSSPSHEAYPNISKHQQTINVEMGLAQSIQDFPKKEYVFALSTFFGDVYLFEATSHAEVEDWIKAIHSGCVQSSIIQHGRSFTVQLLQEEIENMQSSIDLDINMKQMASNHLSSASDFKSKLAIERQIVQWDENLDKLYIEKFRLQCYQALLKNTDPPSAKDVLDKISKETAKVITSKLGIFTLVAGHALMCSKTLLSTIKVTSERKNNIFHKHWIEKSSTASKQCFDNSLQVLTGAQQNGGSFRETFNRRESKVVALQQDSDKHPTQEEQESKDPKKWYDTRCLRVKLPSEQIIKLFVPKKISVLETLLLICNKKQLNSNDCFIRLKISDSSYIIPEMSFLLHNDEFQELEVCNKIIFQLQLERNETEEFGLSLDPELRDDNEEEDELCVFVSHVEANSIASDKGIHVGDEILVINGKVIKELDMMFVESILADELVVMLTIRSCRIECKPMLVNTSGLQTYADAYIDSMVCPPPPAQNTLTNQSIEDLIIPAPNWITSQNSWFPLERSSATSSKMNVSAASSSSSSSSPSPEHQSLWSVDINIDNLLVNAEQVTTFCRVSKQPLCYQEEVGDNHADDKYVPMLITKSDDALKIRKILLELVDTEKQYNKDLTCLMQRYLEPLKDETFLSCEDVEVLFGNLQEIAQFQVLFLHSLENALHVDSNFLSLNKIEDFSQVLHTVADIFLNHGNQFKLYSSFCASHTKAQKILRTDENKALQNFLTARNPQNQHSATMESFLIKPIQRILKYPLLLKQLMEVTDVCSTEHQYLAAALKNMETVAEHINGVQKIYEEYGTIFDNMTKMLKETKESTFEINVGDIQMYGKVDWLNSCDQLGKIKRGSEIETIVFILKLGIVIIAFERANKSIKRKSRYTPISFASLHRQSSNGEDTARYQIALEMNNVKIHELHPKSEAEVKLGLWQIVHCRSEEKGRPEEIYQFASSVEARSNFMRFIKFAKK